MTASGGLRLGVLVVAIALIGCAGPAPTIVATAGPADATATAASSTPASPQAAPSATEVPASPSLRPTDAAQPSEAAGTPEPQTPKPTGTGPDPSPSPPEAVKPLPKPALKSIEEITGAFYDTRRHAQAVVSMLDQLGVGLYNADGTPVRTGSESSDADLFVYEDEARGMVQMLRDGIDFEQWISFRDFHAALAGLGFEGTAQQLAQAYTEAYDADPDSLISQLVYSLGGVDVDTPMPPLEQWLLFVDGFVKPSRAPVASTNGSRGMALETAAGGKGWGVAADAVSEVSPVPLEADPLVIAHLMLVVHSSSLVVDAAPGKVHEGHGGAGPPVQISATVRAVAGAFVSPFSNVPLIPVNGGGSQGIPVTWQRNAALERHGQVNLPGASVTDALGRTSFTYTPKAEKADGKGSPTLELATLQASVPASQLVTSIYGMPSLGALVGGEVRGIGHLQVEWHAAQAMRIKLVEDYTVTLDFGIVGGEAKGRDSFEGTLALQEDGTWRGMVIGGAAGSFKGQALGHTCSDSWNAAQDVEVVGAAAPYAINGDFYFRFYPRTQPLGDVGSGGDCTSTPPTYEGVDYAPYNDESIRSAAMDQGLVITLPPRPGDSRDYPIKLPGVVDATWHVTIEYLEP